MVQNCSLSPHPTPNVLSTFISSWRKFANEGTCVIKERKRCHKDENEGRGKADGEVRGEDESSVGVLKLHGREKMSFSDTVRHKWAGGRRKKILKKKRKCKLVGKNQEGELQYGRHITSARKVVTKMRVFD